MIRRSAETVTACDLVIATQAVAAAVVEVRAMVEARTRPQAGRSSAQRR